MNMLTKFQSDIEADTKQIDVEPRTSIQFKPGSRTKPPRDPKKNTTTLKNTQLESKRIACSGVPFVLIYEFASAKMVFL